MSCNQIELTEIYNNSIKGNKTNNQELLSFSKFPTIGLRKNFSINYIPDSASSATALASGLLTNYGMINIDEQNNIIKPITYDLKEKGYKIGIITNTAINHATPAAFYAINRDRNNYDQIAEQLTDSKFDYFAGGDIYLINKNKNVIFDKLINNGYDIINNSDDLNNIQSEQKYIIISPSATNGGALPLVIDQYNEFNLQNYVKKGIQVLNNKKGFFMMIESGNIDGAAHNNDLKSMISEINELDYTVQIALEFAKKHPKETLIIVTGDHETGGLTLGNNELKYYFNFNSLDNQKLSFSSLYWYSREIINDNMTYEILIDNLKQYYGITNHEDIVIIENIYNKIKNGDNEILKQTVMDILNKNAGIHFGSTNHTAALVPVYVFGPKNEIFSGLYSSTDFNQKLRQILNI